jgi:ABC-type dipeptide/oligopeptide/nickel transport system permease component
MLSFIVKRLSLAIPTLLAVSFLVFIVARAAPSGPVEIMLGEKATPEAVARLKHEYGLDRPVLVQYLEYVWNIAAHGDFGRSFTRGGQPISDMIRRDFPVTADLATKALLFAMLIGLPIGVLAALKHNSWFDRIAMAGVVAMVSVPSIVLGPLLVLFVAVRLRWLPVSGWEDWRYVILPTVTLGSRSAALLARFMRSSLLDVLRQDYIRTAMAKGLSRNRAVWRHALKNAFLPVLTVIGTNLGYLLTGSFVVETIFQVPGIGHESIDSITRRDYPVIQGMALLVAIIFVFVNLAVDILYGVIDPRVRAQEA